MPSNLSLRIVGDCDQGLIEQFTFYSGETRTLRFQVYDDNNNQKVCVPSTAVKTVTIPAVTEADIEILDADITQDANCPSVFGVDLDATQTGNIMTGWLKFEYVDAGLTRIAYADFVIKKMLT